MHTRWIVALTLAICALVGSWACVSTNERSRPSADPLVEFRQRVEAYMKLHDRLEREAPPLKTSADSSKIQAAEQSLASRIRAARADARQGDIFTPAVATRLRQLLDPELRGSESAGTRASIREGAPAEFTLSVNGSYPVKAPLATAPPNMLKVLPPLPEDLEYRIVDRHLILFDVAANIVVDYMYDVMCDKC